MVAPRPPTDGPRRILIVEDDAEIGTLLVGVLEDAGYLPELVTSPEAAGGPYDLVITDYLAPRYVAGEPWPHLDLLRRLGEGGEIPVIGCTAHPDAHAEEPARVGLAALALKPFDVEDLLQTVAAVLDASPDQTGGASSPGSRRW
jgi:CheY-like chemotaxis protein